MGKLSNCSPACRKLYLAAYCRTEGNCGGKLFFSPPRHGVDGAALKASKLLECTPKNATILKDQDDPEVYLKETTKQAWNQYFNSLENKLTNELDRKPKPNSCTLLGLVTEMMFVNGVLAGANLDQHGFDLSDLHAGDYFSDTKTYQVPPNFKGEDGKLHRSLAPLNICRVNKGGSVTIQTEQAKATLLQLGEVAARGGARAQAETIEGWHHAAWVAYSQHMGTQFIKALADKKKWSSCHALDMFQELLCIALIAGNDPTDLMKRASEEIGKLPAWKVVEGRQGAPQE